VSRGRCARARREHYVGEWLPEPVLTDGEDDPAVHAELADSLSMALLVALETLSPEQRAVLLLRDVFDYPFAEIARRRPGARARAPAQRKQRVARTLINWLRLRSRVPGGSASFAHVNGSPGALLRDGEGRLIAVWVIEVADGRVARVNSIVNPDKLRHLGPVADFGSLLSGSRERGARTPRRS
jgi:hypothetical protein